LRREDFFLVDTDLAAPEKPDFSAAGLPIEFGYLSAVVSTATQTSRVFRWGIDNYRVVLVSPQEPDSDGDGDVDLDDYALFAACLNGPDMAPATGCTVNADLDADTDVDLDDFAVFTASFSVSPPGPMPDLDGDGDVDLDDYAVFAACLNGPDMAPAGGCTVNADFDGDTDVDVNDFAVFQAAFTG
jgi:hypothetical protein